MMFHVGGEPFDKLRANGDLISDTPKWTGIRNTSPVPVWATGSYSQFHHLLTGIFREKRFIAHKIPVKLG